MKPKITLSTSPRLEPARQSAAGGVHNMTLAESHVLGKNVRRGGGGWPKADGAPVVGNFFSMSRDPRLFLVEQYRKLGPVFEIRAFHKRIVVLAGREANLFLIRHGKTYLRSRETWADFGEALGATNILTGMDGPEHLRMRKAQHDGFSRALIERRLPEAVTVAERQLAELPLHNPIVVSELCQRLVTEQIVMLTTGAPPGETSEYLEDIRTFVHANLKTYVTRTQPAFMMRMPKTRRARRRMEELYRKILDARAAPAHTPGAGRDLVDDMLALHSSDPNLLPETDLFPVLTGPYFAGMDTAASVMAFMLYALLKHPDALARVQKEAERLFADGPPTGEGISGMTDTWQALQETLRLYPIALALPRHTANSFEFAGYHIPAGTPLLVATAVPHHLEEYYPDPERFDLDRFAPERRESVRSGTFAPFGLGHHSCLGQGFAQVQLALNVATLLHHTELAMDPPGYRLKVDQAPLPRPASDFKIRILGRR